MLGAVVAVADVARMVVRAACGRGGRSIEAAMVFAHGVAVVLEAMESVVAVVTVFVVSTGWSEWS